MIDPLKTWQKSKLIKSLAKLKRFNGEYNGVLQRLVGERSGDTDHIYLAIDFIKKGSEIEGEFRAEMASNGEVYSNSKGSGGNNDIRMVGNDLIIETSPFAFIFFKNSNLSEGSFYSRGSFVGLVKLQRMN